MTPENIKKILSDHSDWLSNPETGKCANLRGANLRGANLRGADLRGADLRGANLRGANLFGADLRGADLRDTNLSDTNLSDTNLRDTNLSDTNLSDTNLFGANLSGADLRGADLFGANLSGADLFGANLSGANLLCSGDMIFVKTLQIEKWKIAYTSNVIQIGCQIHTIEKWAKWETEVGKKWISKMDKEALDWAEIHLNIVLKLIELSPAKKNKYK